jgi:formylglycine-generating enzyme
MLRLPGGTFLMGDLAGDGAGRDGHDHSLPVHEVQIAAFAIGKYHVTRGEYAAFILATGYPDGTDCFADFSGTGSGQRKQEHAANWRNNGYPQTDRDPVVCVSWDDATAYARWLSDLTGHEYRLPSESEWEYAARAGTRTRYFWGDSSEDACLYANGSDLTLHAYHPEWESLSCSDGYANTAPVGSFRPNAFGLYDMSGNAWQWVEDCWADDFNVQPRDGSPWLPADCPAHVRRGGTFAIHPGLLRVATRVSLPPTGRGDLNGFRVAMTLPDSRPGRYRR